MHIKALRIKNFRRLCDVKIDLAKDISIFVGSNNSGKTSVCHAIQLFTAEKSTFTIHDFNNDCWTTINQFGQEEAEILLPTISLDIWLHVENTDLHRVVDLLPGLDWQETPVGIRIEFQAKDPENLLNSFKAAREQATEARKSLGNEPQYQPYPKDLRDYLEKELSKEFGRRYYVLDYSCFQDDFTEQEGYEPAPLLSDGDRSPLKILESLIRVDILNAQRHLTDSESGARGEDLSRCLSRFYRRNLEKQSDDHRAIYVLSESESMLNEHLQRVFTPTLKQLSSLGYPGFSNPSLLIKTALTPTSVMNGRDSTKVHYALNESQGGGETQTLPDRYNGLGFKNLIYMVIELLDLHAQWMEIEENRPPVHLVFIEEPEAHLHTQLQQVFIRKVIDIVNDVEQSHYKTQLAITTHSPHILYEKGFRPIRYFRRSTESGRHSSEVLNLSRFYEKTEDNTRDFLERYLKLTHCDLFFADAAILVEGNVERLLLPAIIEKEARGLQSACLSILEIGGAYGHRFKPLMDFLDITTLIITDIDSVIGPDNIDADHVPDNDYTGKGNEPKKGHVCMADVKNATTSNQTLIQWLPKKNSISDLLSASTSANPNACIQQRENESTLTHVVYQTKTIANWNDETKDITGRTFEEAFAFQNLDICQNKDYKDLKLYFPKSESLKLEEITSRIHKRVHSDYFKKTDFALALLEKDPGKWHVPDYIRNGLKWLEAEIIPADLISPQPQKVEEFDDKTNPST